MNNTTAIGIIKTYTANFIAAEPDSAEVETYVAAAFAKYLAAEVDPRKFPYYPHPYNEAETILHHAAAHIIKAAA